jgi:hypothetical protein
VRGNITTLAYSAFAIVLKPAPPPAPVDSTPYVAIFLGVGFAILGAIIGVVVYLVVRQKRDMVQEMVSRASTAVLDLSSPRAIVRVSSVKSATYKAKPGEDAPLPPEVAQFATRKVLSPAQSYFRHGSRPTMGGEDLQEKVCMSAPLFCCLCPSVSLSLSFPLSLSI